MPQFHLGPGPEEDEPYEVLAGLMKTANFIYWWETLWVQKEHRPAPGIAQIL